MSKFGRWLNKGLETLTIALLLLTIVNVFIDVVLRYGFNNSYIGLQELEWHLFSSLFLLGMSYALQKDAHVRVDIFYQRHSQYKKSLIDFIGHILLVLPLSILIVYHGSDFAYQSFELLEQSGDPGGLSYRFIIKSVIPLSFILLIMSSLDSIYRAWCNIKSPTSKAPHNHQQGQL